MNADTIPCSQLAAPALVARVASTMDENGTSTPPYPPKPGRCRFCGHALPCAFSAVAHDRGKLERVDWNEGDPIAERLNFNAGGAVTLGAGIALVHRKEAHGFKTDQGLRHIGEHFPTVLLAANGSCDALTGDVFAQASRIAREKADKRRVAIQTHQSAKEIASKKAAAAAARRLAGNMAPAAPDDGGF